MKKNYNMFSGYSIKLWNAYRNGEIYIQGQFGAPIGFDAISWSPSAIYNQL